MKNPLCAYKNILGEPNQGWRAKYRFLDVSYIDVLLVLAFCVILAWVTNYPLIFIIVVTFFVGIIAHRLFCVRTRVDRWLFSS